MRDILKGALFGLVFMACLIGVLIAPANGSTHSAKAHKCTSSYDVGLGLHNDENGGQADWEINGCNETMQTRVECRNDITGADYYVYSGEVHGLEIDDWAACNFGDYVYDFWVDPFDTNNWVDV